MEKGFWKINIEILSGDNYVILAENVNGFLSNMSPERLIDIKYQDTENNTSAMIIYKSFIEMED